ncbi:MAG: signal peptidase I [Caldilineales bacterium]|nr:signal peptidase I [Caldilineales bacterium]
MHDQTRSSSGLPPDARIIRPDAQPQRYDSAPALPTTRPTPPPSRDGSPSLWQGAREMIETVLPAVLIALLIHLFLAQATRVEGYSMEPTLYGHQRLVIEKLSYHLHPPARDDIVVIRVPGFGKEMLIKRVIGLPGEAIEVRDGRVLINGRALDEPYLRTVTRGTYPETRIPEGYVFVMGDNRNNSNDSRSFGAIPFDQVVGRAWVRYWPFTDVGFVH